MKKIEKYIKKEFIIYLVVGIGLVIGIKTKFFNSELVNKQLEINQEQIENSDVKEKDEIVDAEINQKMYVDIKGAVKNPGMYEVSSDMRVLNVIDLAGGLSKEADDKQINFSQKLEDQMIVYVPIEGEEIPTSLNKGVNGNSLDKKSNDDKININQAEKEELMTLNGVGEKKAEKIIEYREEKGSFKSIDDLKNVNGFGDKTVESLKETIEI